jgi:hypothetical protein
MNDMYLNAIKSRKGMGEESKEHGEKIMKAEKGEDSLIAELESLIQDNPKAMAVLEKMKGVQSEEVDAEKEVHEDESKDESEDEDEGKEEMKEEMLSRMSDFDKEDLKGRKPRSLGERARQMALKE